MTDVNRKPKRRKKRKEKQAMRKSVQIDEYWARKWGGRGLSGESSNMKQIEQSCSCHKSRFRHESVNFRSQLIRLGVEAINCFSKPFGKAHSK
jgi:hypothetical protein